ncbi:MAG: NifB/NifX family molybdenum-iron cluster-binding protein [Kiritimatiellae bacterium]|nr:NifB/NifX family molybdenum-iron cluster-binding protein [Kiritimatiellia bacterium]MDD4734787.1 NifB/NifX family molybdenum-iron cluster-binding protein [Kiritimatiellia bacterium]
MKVIITAKGETIESEADLHFGRAKYFLLVDTETGECTAHDNKQNLNAAQGAGIQSAETVIRLGAEAVITGNVGPKAFRVLSGSEIPVFLVPAESTVSQAVELMKAAQLPRADGATKEGHWV